MIKISGVANFTVPFEVELSMTEDQWDKLSEREKREIIDGFIGWDEMQSAEMDDCDVYDLEEVEEDSE